MRICSCLTYAVLAVWVASSLPLVFGQPKPQRKLYSDENLAEARMALKDCQFKDQNVKKVFAPQNNEYVGVMLEIKREGNVISEIVVYGRTASKKQLTKLTTLDGKTNSGDLKTLVDKLKL